MYIKNQLKFRLITNNLITLDKVICLHVLKNIYIEARLTKSLDDQNVGVL